MNWYLAVLENYAGFSGRARRMEYWMFALFSAVIIVVLDVIGKAVGLGFLIGGLYALVVLIPSLAVTVRRLHDTGKSGWWILIGIVPFVGAIILLIFMLLPGDHGGNAHGPDPKLVP